MLAVIDDAVADRLAILITIPYHVRSAEELWRRYRKQAETTIHGHPAAAKRLEDRSAFRAIEPGTPLPGGATAHTIGKPRRYETPLHLPSHEALVFGDAVAESDGRLVVWASRKDRRQGRALLPRALQPDARAAAGARLRQRARDPRRSRSSAAASEALRRALDGEALVPPRG